MKTNAPKGAPKNVALAHFSEAAPETVELTIKVSDRDRIKGYGFAYDRSPVPINGGRGKFFAVLGAKNKLLEWVMIGDPGGSMKVTVTRGAVTVDERKKSTIPNGYNKGYDAFNIEVV